MGSQLWSLNLPKILAPNGTGLISQAVGLNDSAIRNSAEDLFNSFISTNETKPKDVDRIIKLLEDLIKEQDGLAQTGDKKIKAALKNLNKVKKAAKAAIAVADGKLELEKKANQKVKVDEGKKVAAAKQAHTDAKSAKNQQMPNINHQKKIIQLVIEYLRPLSTQKTISYANKWTKCVGNYACKDYGVNKVCIGERYYQPYRTVSVLPGRKYVVTLDYFAMYSWDGEYGRVYLNGKLCWNKRIRHKSTKKNCGPWSHNSAQKFRVSCNAVGANNGELTVRVASTLNERYPNENFGVANLKVYRVGA